MRSCWVGTAWIGALYTSKEYCSHGLWCEWHPLEVWNVQAAQPDLMAVHCNSLKMSKTDWSVGPFYLSFQELGRSSYYRRVSPEVSVGADSLRKAGPAAHSGRIGSGPLPHRSPCTAEEGSIRHTQLDGTDLMSATSKKGAPGLRTWPRRLLINHPVPGTCTCGPQTF